MNRRGFFKTLGLGLGAVVAAPYVPLGKWLTHASNYGYRHVTVPTKYLYSRITITGPVMAVSYYHQGAFVHAHHAECARLLKDIQRDNNLAQRRSVLECVASGAL